MSWQTLRIMSFHKSNGGLTFLASCCRVRTVVCLSLIVTGGAFVSTVVLHRSRRVAAVHRMKIFGGGWLVPADIFVQIEKSSREPPRPPLPPELIDSRVCSECVRMKRRRQFCLAVSHSLGPFSGGRPVPANRHQYRTGVILT